MATVLKWELVSQNLNQMGLGMKANSKLGCGMEKELCPCQTGVHILEISRPENSVGEVGIDYHQLRYEWSDGRNYEGEWKEGHISGRGIMKWPDGREYAGDFLNDKRNGFGTYRWSGRCYIGEWMNGQ